MDDNTVFSIEKGLDRLAEINQKLSDQNISLDEAMNLYAESVKLSKQCKDSLEDTKKKIIEIDPTLVQ